MTGLKTKENLIATFKNKCRTNGLKVTPQRTIIYEELLDSNDHPNVELLYERVRKRLPDISFDTVYRTLLTFHEQNLAGVVEGLSTTRRYDYNTDKHYHFICLKCGAIKDIMEVPYNFKIPEDVMKNYSPENTRIIFEGTCKNC